MEGKNSTCIEQSQLANGMTVSLLDLSRPLAGDRWLVELECRATIPVIKDWLTPQDTDDGQLAADVYKAMGEELSWSVKKHRHFVATHDKEAALLEMTRQVRDHLMVYLNDPQFPRQLLRRRYQETRERLRLSTQAHSAENIAEDEGPTDFSFLNLASPPPSGDQHS